MADSENSPAVAPAEAARPGKLRRALQWYWGQRDSAERGEPVKRTLVALVLLALGVGGSEAYGYVRDKFRDPDAYLVQMKQDQDAAFKKLQGSLDALGSSVEGNGRAARLVAASPQGQQWLGRVATEGELTASSLQSD